MVELSRTGLRLTTPMAIDEGETIGLTLTYNLEKVDLKAIVRWRREADSATDGSELAYWEIGLAFIAVGEVDPEGIWRSLRIYGE